MTGHSPTAAPPLPIRNPLVRISPHAATWDLVTQIWEYLPGKAEAVLADSVADRYECRKFLAFALC